jgi:hypothetical protein
MLCSSYTDERANQADPPETLPPGYMKNPAQKDILETIP